MKNADAIELFDRLYINVLRKELDEQDEQYQNLKTLLEAGLRSCGICRRSNDQGDMIHAYATWCHVDCAAEHHDNMLLDPTTQYIGETNEAYEIRMDREFPDL
jgi:hypothetical protein